VWAINCNLNDQAGHFGTRSGAAEGWSGYTSPNETRYRGDESSSYINFPSVQAHMCSSEVVVWGFMGLLFGPPATIWPYKIARWGEILDAIGRKPNGRVEPAGWNVALTRISGVVFSLIGLYFLIFCVVF